MIGQERSDSGFSTWQALRRSHANNGAECHHDRMTGTASTMDARWKYMFTMHCYRMRTISRYFVVLQGVTSGCETQLRMTLG
jgi:hypothetical protein